MGKGNLTNKDKVFLIDFGYSRILDFDIKNYNEIKNSLIEKEGCDFSKKKIVMKVLQNLWLLK